MNPISRIEITECPRDAMQGLSAFIPTSLKAKYINSLIRVGFNTIDFGSFVSPESIPQMADTSDVLRMLNLPASGAPKLLAIVANERGAEDALAFDEIDYLGYPFSASPTFSIKNLRADINSSLNRLEGIAELIQNHRGKEIVAYISMAFGNPYGDEFTNEVLFNHIERIKSFNINKIKLSDTIGMSDSNSVASVVSYCIESFPEIEFGVHFHSSKSSWKEKIESAFNKGIMRFDSAIMGFGGCPLSGYNLVGNISTEDLISYFESVGAVTNLNLEALNDSYKIANAIFS